MDLGDDRFYLRSYFGALEYRGDANIALLGGVYHFSYFALCCFCA
jgi:hypothetical protein